MLQVWQMWPRQCPIGELDEAAGIAVLKKAIDLNAAGALALIEALPDNSSTQNLPAHLGKNINTTA